MELGRKKYSPKYPVQTLEKALDIIGILAKEGGDEGLGISELSKILGLGKSTIHRILDTLVSYGYIEQPVDSTKYRLGWTIFEIGNVIPRQRNLNNFDMKILQELCNEFEETVNLGVRVDNHIVTISKIEPTASLMANLQIGKSEPLHATAMGKVIISELTKNQIEELVGIGELKEYTTNTIKNTEELIEELEKIRKQGYSIDDEEFCFGLSCIAMPVRNYENEIVAAVSVSGPSIRLNFSKIMDIKNSLEVATKKLSAYLGYKIYK